MTEPESDFESPEGEPTDVPITSSVVRSVTLFEDRAEVCRRARVTLQPGEQTIRIGPITAVVDERSLQAEVVSTDTREPLDKGSKTETPDTETPDPESAGENGDFDGARVTAARVHRRVLDAPRESDKKVAELEAAWRQARKERIEASRRARAAAEARARAGALSQQWWEGIGQVPRNIAESVENWRETGNKLQNAERAALDRWLQARSDEKDRLEDEDHARVRLETARQREPVIDASATLQIEAVGACDVVVEIRYRTPCALWRPEHVAQLDDTGHLTIITWATMWQNTGESWENVEVRCSTARPSQAASPPELPEDQIYSREKSPLERKVIEVESRDQTVEAARKPDGTGAVVDEMPGVDDGGEPLEFVGRERIDLPSTGEPFRVELTRTELEAEVDRVLRPEVSRVAHVRARGTHSASVPLLAGPVRIVSNGALLGRGRMPFVAPGEPFELGMGSDEAVRVKRRESTLDDDRGMTGTRTVERQIEVFLSNLGSEPRSVKIRERIPVSEVDGLDVGLLDADVFQFDESDGFLDTEIELEPHAEETLTIRYRVKAASKVLLPF